jgi:twitching motility protein PilJ
VSAREAQTSINNDSEPLLRQQLEQLQTAPQGLAGPACSAGSAGHRHFDLVLSGIGISRVQLLDSRARQQEAERSRSMHVCRSRKPSASTTPTRRLFCV